jgi:type II secretory pathway pseudopilin PulG
MESGNKREQGATFALLMLAVALMGITLSVAAQQWKALVRREKEAELIFRGIEIQTALAAYSAQQKKGRVAPGEVYPLTLEELTKPPKPALRKAYKDPMTGEDWEYVRDPTGRIRGVKSKSKEQPFKQHEFPPAIRHFEGLTSYDMWVFQYPNASTPQAPQPPPTPLPAAPGTPGAPGGPSTIPLTPPPGGPGTLTKPIPSPPEAPTPGPVPIIPPSPAVVLPPAGM